MNHALNRLHIELETLGENYRIASSEMRLADAKTLHQQIEETKQAIDVLEDETFSQPVAAPKPIGKPSIVTGEGSPDDSATLSRYVHAELRSTDPTPEITTLNHGTITFTK